MRSDPYPILRTPKGMVIGAFMAALLPACGKHSEVKNHDAGVARVKAKPKVLRKPSKELLARWRPPSDPTFIAFGDLTGLFELQFVEQIVRSTTGLYSSILPRATVNCVKQWPRAVRDAIASGNEKDFLIVIKYDQGALNDPLGPCIQSLVKMPSAKIEDVPEAYQMGSWLLAILPDVVMMGTRNAIQTNMFKGFRPKWPSDFGLEKGQQLAIAVHDAEHEFNAEGSIRASHTALQVSINAELANEEIAQKTVDRASVDALKSQLQQLKLDLQQPVVDRILESWHIERAERRIQFSYDAEGKSEEIAQQLGLLMASEIFRQRKESAEGHADQARDNVRAIAQRLKLSGLKKFESLPPVPSDFKRVKARQYQSRVVDWGSWKNIDFALEGFQRYQYRVQAAKDGRSAEVIAEGDLNGDGRRSRFALVVSLHKSPEADAGADEPIDEQDPLE